MIKIIAVGKIKDKNLKEIIEVHKKRIECFIKIEEVEIKPEKDKDPGKIAIKRESERILKAINHRNFRILLDRKGKMFSSENFSKLIEKLINERKKINFVIGGAWGVDERIFSEFDLILSFSKMTFPHELARLIIYEQIYRAFTIIKKTGYHK